MNLLILRYKTEGEGRGERKQGGGKREGGLSQGHSSCCTQGHVVDSDAMLLKESTGGPRGTQYRKSISTNNYEHCQSSDPPCLCCCMTAQGSEAFKSRHHRKEEVQTTPKQ